MRASGLRRATIILVSLMVSGCAVLRPQADAMDYSGMPAIGSPSKSVLAPLNSDLPFAANFDAALRQAQELRKRGELDAASRVLAQLVLVAPDDPRIIGEYGKVMLESGHTGDAVAFLERAVVLQPSDWSLFSALGVAYDQSGKSEAARAAYDRALAIKPGESTVLSNLALSHIQAGELDEAERLLLQISEQDKDLPGVAAKLAMVRNIRSTTAQSRPLAVTTLPDPLASVPEAQPLPADPLVQAPVDVESVPVSSPVSPAPGQDEEADSVEDAETESVAVVAPVTPKASAEIIVVETSNNNIIDQISNVSHENTAASYETAGTDHQARNINRLQSILKVQSRQSVAVVAPTKISVTSSAGPAKAVPAPKTTAAPTTRPQPTVVRPTDVRAVAANSAAAKPVAPVIAAISARAPTAAEPASLSPQTAIMTRRAGVAAAVTRTAPVPLVLAPARDSWESSVRVSLPEASAAAPKPAALGEPDSAPSAEPSTWTGMVTNWVVAALSFIASFWA